MIKSGSTKSRSRSGSGHSRRKKRTAASAVSRLLRRTGVSSACRKRKNTLRRRLLKGMAVVGAAASLTLASVFYAEPLQSGLEKLPGGAYVGACVQRLADGLGGLAGLLPEFSLPHISLPELTDQATRMLGELADFFDGQALPASSAPLSLADIPPYSGEPYAEINGNVPYFTEAELTTKDYEQYAPLDALGRCGAAVACVGKDLMPTEERGAIGQVRPSGWQTVKYDFVDGKYLYNRCHLIGYQLSGENANVSNLITGTRYLNIDGMLSFENEVANYVQTTGNHVMYRVTPLFDGSNLVASGVEMEGYSVEDKGSGVCFHVFAYNVQPGVVIDYATGVSRQE